MKYFETKYRDKSGICRVCKTKKLTEMHKLAHDVDANAITKEIDIDENTDVKTETTITL